MLIKTLAALLILLCVNAETFTQPSPPLGREQEQKRFREREKTIREMLETVASEIASLKIPENRVIFQSRMADLVWNFDEKRARSLIEDARNELVGLQSGPAYNRMRQRFGHYHLQLRSGIVGSLARRDPQLALDFLRGTRPPAPSDDAAKRAADEEARLEQDLAVKIAENDPARAMQLAEESLETGFSYDLDRFVQVVVEKDSEAGKKLAKKIVEKLKTTDPTKDQSAYSFAFSFLEGEFSARRSELTPGEKMYGVKRRKPSLDDQALREWAELAGRFALAIINPAIQQGGLPGEMSNWLSTAMRILPDLEKIAPTMAGTLRRKYAELSPRLGDRDKHNIEVNNLYRNGKVEDFLALAEKAPAERRGELLRSAIHHALNSEANVELASKIIDEKITDPNERKNQLAYVEWVNAQYAASQGKIEESLASLAHLESDVERAQTLVYIVERPLKAGNKKLAAQLLDKALAFLPPQLETSKQFEVMIRIIGKLAEIDAERGFALCESQIEPINQIMSAYIQMSRFDESRYGYVLKDEMMISSGWRDSSWPIIALAEEMTALAKSDFDRALDLAGRFKQTELRIHARLRAIQAIFPGR